MIEIPELSVNFGDLWKMLIAPVRSKLLLTAIELKAFNHLSKPVSAEVVAKSMGTHPRNTELFLDGLTAIDLVLKKNGLYQNAPISETFLVEDTQTYLGQLLTHMARTDPPLENLSKLVKEGPPPPPETSQFSEEMLAQGALMMVNSERAGDAQLVTREVSKLPEFPSFRKMLDLGGGPGIIGMAVVAAHPSMKGIIFDLPAVVKVAATFIKDYELEDRMGTLSGDFNRDFIGEGYDLILACNSLQFARDIDSVLKKIYYALNYGGVFSSIYGFGQTHERTKPENLVLSLLSLALMGEDTSMFYRGFIADSMLRVGFKSVRSRTLHMGWGPVELDIARK